MEEELRKKQELDGEQGEHGSETRRAALPSGRAGGRRGEMARQLIGRAKQASRSKFPAEEKILIMMEGIRAEVLVAYLFRREGIHPTIYYRWLRDFMETGKGRLRGDAKRAGGHQQRGAGVAVGKRAAEAAGSHLSLENLMLKKNHHEGCERAMRHSNMSFAFGG